MLTVVVTVGLLLLLVGGAVQLSSTALAGPTAKRDQLVSTDVTVLTPADHRDPTRIVDDRRKLRNAFVVLLEATTIVLSVWMVTYVFALGGIATAFKVALGATLLVGATLVGRGMYVRLGFYRPDLETVEDYRASLTESLGEGVAADFAEIHTAMATARAEEGPDEATVGVLAAARNEQSLDELGRWAEAADVATVEECTDRADSLAEAGVVEREGDRLAVGDRLADADNDQMAALATSLLH